MERAAGIEPALSGRKHDILPLNYTRILGQPAYKASPLF